MLNLTTVNPVSWPTAPSTAVPPVPAIAAVQAVPGAGRDPQSGLGAGQDRALPQKKDRSTASPDGAPLLPRSKGNAAVAPEGPAAALAEAAARKAAEEAAAAQAEEQANAKEEIHQRLQEVLSTVWQASAAVVDRALGRDPSDSPVVAGAGSSVSAVPPRRALLVLPSGAGVGPSSGAAEVPAFANAVSVPLANDGSAAKSASSAAPELVAYDEHGNGSVSSPEAGSLLSRRV